MILSVTTARKLGGLSLLALLGLAVLILPTGPTRGQEPKKNVDPGQIKEKVTLQTGGSGSMMFVQPPQDLDKARAELERAARELARFEQELQRMHAELERRMADLAAAKAQLKQAEFAALSKQKYDELRKESRPGSPPSGGTGTMAIIVQPGLEKRLGDMERKLDQVLEELQNLRTAAGKTPAKGTGGKGGGGGGGGIGGGGGGFGDPFGGGGFSKKGGGAGFGGGGASGGSFDKGAGGKGGFGGSGGSSGGSGGSVVPPKDPGNQGKSGSGDTGGDGRPGKAMNKQAIEDSLYADLDHGNVFTFP